MYWKLNHPNKYPKKLQDFFHQQSARNILDSGLVSPSQPHLVMPKNCSMLCICSRTCQEQWPQEPHLSLVTVRYSQHLPDEIVNGTFGKCLSGTRYVNKTYNPTTAIKTITHDNYVRIFLNNSLSVFNNILFFETLSVADAKWNSNPFCSNSWKKKHEQHHCPIIIRQLPQTDMAFEPSKKKRFPSYYIVVLQGSLKCFF